jgi:hypothetical protein
VRRYRNEQANKSKLLTRDLILDSDDYVMAIERYSVSITSIIGWDRRIDRKNDYVAGLALRIMEHVDWVTPGRYILETLSFLDWLPAWLYNFPARIRKGSELSIRYSYMSSQEGAQAKQKNFLEN